MPAEFTLPVPLRPHPQPRGSRPLSLTIPPHQLPPSAAHAPSPAATTTSARPQREAATTAKKRVEDAYAFYAYEQGPDSDSDATSTRPSAPRHATVHSEDDSSDSDVFVDDSESDCPRPSKAARPRKRKRSASLMMGGGERRRFKAGKVLEVDGKRLKEGTTGLMVKSGNMVKDNLWGKGGRGSRDSLCEELGRYVRRAGLNDMGPETGSYTSSRRDDVWTKELGLESRKSGAKGPVDVDGYRVSRFSEHL